MLFFLSIGFAFCACGHTYNHVTPFLSISAVAALPPILDILKPGAVLSISPVLRLDAFNTSLEFKATTPAISVSSVQLGEGQGVVLLGLGLSEPVSVPLTSATALATAVSGAAWVPLGSLDMILPVMHNDAMLAAARMQDADLLDKVAPKLALDFDIAALKDDIIAFLKSLEQTKFDLKGTERDCLHRKLAEDAQAVAASKVFVCIYFPLGMASTKLGLDISSIPGIDDVSSAIASLNDLVHFTDAAKGYFGVARRRRRRRRDVFAAVGLPQYTFAGLVVRTREVKVCALRTLLTSHFRLRRKHWSMKYKRTRPPISQCSLQMGFHFMAGTTVRIRR